MYFLSEVEKKHVLRGMIPRARENPVAEELRGWNWHTPPLLPCYDRTRLGVFEVAGKYCPSGRDVYLRRVQRIDVPASPAMVGGGVLHRLVARLVLAAKALMYSEGVTGATKVESGLRDLAARLTTAESLSADNSGVATLSTEAMEALTGRCRALAGFEVARIIARLQETLAGFPHIGTDALCNIVLPVVVEQRLNGSLLGLSESLSTDALMVGQPLVVDVKYGRVQDFHRLSTTGYALVIEAIHETPVDIGCITYGQFKEGRLIVHRDLHLIDDELRQWFIEERDQKARWVAEEIDPGLPDTCPRYCQYLSVCRGEGETGRRSKGGREGRNR